MRVRIKIVPKASPNDDGEWRDVPLSWLESNQYPLHERGWVSVAAYFAPLVPEGFFLCAVETMP